MTKEQQLKEKFEAKYKDFCANRLDLGLPQFAYEILPFFLSERRSELSELKAKIEGKRRDGEWKGVVSAQEDEVYNDAIDDFSALLEELITNKE